jgi:cellulose synthase/poly-beta-1,6-N-acetylglucosamine synthase-like glycosyltransferase
MAAVVVSEDSQTTAATTSGVILTPNMEPVLPDNFYERSRNFNRNVELYKKKRKDSYRYLIISLILLVITFIIFIIANKYNNKPLLITSICTFVLFAVCYAIYSWKNFIVNEFGNKAIIEGQELNREIKQTNKQLESANNQLENVNINDIV